MRMTIVGVVFFLVLSSSDQNSRICAWLAMVFQFTGPFWVQYSDLGGCKICVIAIG